jgi:hypothetical protein
MEFVPSHRHGPKSIPTNCRKRTNRQVSFDISNEEKKLFADNLTDLLLKSREVYLLLISQYPAAHREYRNAQINNPREFKLNNIVFTNVQVQSKDLPEQ